jgi:hypothetical protein
VPTSARRWRTICSGDYFLVELVLGHAEMARRGIALALAELVEEGWLSLADALALVEPLLCGNARRIFHLEKKGLGRSSAPGSSITYWGCSSWVIRGFSVADYTSC